MLLVLDFALFLDIQKADSLYANELTFLNVGQGDSLLVKSEGALGLIDTGPGNLVSSELSTLIPLSRKYLDFVLLTHFDQDHIEGFLRLAQNYEIKKVFIVRSAKENLLIKELEKILIAEKIPTYYLNAENDFRFGELTFNVIWPPKKIDPNIKDSNDFSIGLELILGDCNIYTAGDLSSKFETESLTSLLDKQVEVLKAGHHGSRTSSSNEFVTGISPKSVIVSAEENSRFGHPHKEVLEIFAKNHVEIFETKLGFINATIFKDRIILRQGQMHIEVQCF